MDNNNKVDESEVIKELAKRASLVTKEDLTKLHDDIVKIHDEFHSILEEVRKQGIQEDLVNRLVKKALLYGFVRGVEYAKR